MRTTKNKNMTTTAIPGTQIEVRNPEAMFDVSEGLICSAAEFFEANQGTLDQNEVERINELEVGQEFVSGGGAMGVWSVLRIS